MRCGPHKLLEFADLITASYIDGSIGFSQRTLQSDIRDIRNVFGIDIEYSRSNKEYYISQNETENMNFQRMMEALDMFNSLNIAQDLTPHIHLQRHRAQGTENLYGLLHAIKNRCCIRFSYKKFHHEETSIRVRESTYVYHHLVILHCVRRELKMRVP